MYYFYNYFLINNNKELVFIFRFTICIIDIHSFQNWNYEKNEYLIRIFYVSIGTIPFVSLPVTKKIPEYIENGYYILGYLVIFIIGALIGTYKERELDGYIK